MSLDISAIRRMNQMKFFVECAADPFSELDSQMALSGMWSFTHYSEGGLNLQGDVTFGGFLNDILANNSVVKLAKQGASLAGYSPQLDISRKFLYQGSKPLTFSVKLYLVLEDDIARDFLRPLCRLAYLTYPHRTDTNVVEEFKRLKNTIFGLVDTAVARYQENGDISASDFGIGAGFSQKIDRILDNVLGAANILRIPPTFDMFNGIKGGGSGLSVKYGGFLITDIIIKSMQLNIPTLFVEGGYPQFIEVSLSLETLRVITYDLIRSMVEGMFDSGNQNYGGERFALKPKDKTEGGPA